MWAEAGDHAGDSQGLYQADAHRESPAADDADEDFLDKAEDYERSYNFRCVSFHVMTFAVKISQAMRSVHAQLWCSLHYWCLDHGLCVATGQRASLCVCRSEEPGGTRIVTYPRNIEGLARKEESKRKKQRERRAERRAAAEKDRAAEVKQLKNAKVKEVQNACVSMSRSVHLLIAICAFAFV